MRIYSSINQYINVPDIYISTSQTTADAGSPSRAKEAAKKHTAEGKQWAAERKRLQTAADEAARRAQKVTAELERAQKALGVAEHDSRKRLERGTLPAPAANADDTVMTMAAAVAHR